MATNDKNEAFQHMGSLNKQEEETQIHKKRKSFAKDNNQYSCWFGNKDRGPIWGKASPKEIVDLYDAWAEHGYDEVSYEAPRIAATQVASLYEPSRRSDVAIIDVGAGTGLVGEKLHEFGFRKIDALDPSSGMLDVAREKQVYRHLICNYIQRDTLTDLNGQYDCLTAAGCVIPGHIEADGLHDFIRLVKKGGYVIITMRGHWPDVPDFFENFQKVLRTLVEDRKCQLFNRTVIDNYSCIIPNSTGYKFVLKVL